MNTFQKISYSSLALLASTQSTNAAIMAGGSWNIIKGWIKWSEETADQTIQTYLTNFLTFLWLLAVLYAIYGWYLILTAAWDEAKVKKWKTILFQAILGIIIIFISYSVVSWVLSLIVWTGPTGGTQ